jgi:hypothetical protein
MHPILRHEKVPTKSWHRQSFSNCIWFWV